MIQIAIVDDHAIVRTGLRQFLGEQVDLRVAGEAANGREALELVRQTPVDVLLMDLSMPGQGGVEALQAIKTRYPELPVLILSGFPASRYAPTLMSQGASGYLNKECDPQEIVEAIRVVARGRRYLSAEVAQLLAERALGDGGQAPHEALSERELQVFLRLARGEAVGGIAEAMHLSVKTVSTYRTRVLTKLGLASNSELTHYAITNGLID